MSIHHAIQIRSVPLSMPPRIGLHTLPVYDSECDVTDVYIEQMDPANEDNAIATAYFRHEFDRGQTDVTLCALVIEQDGQPLIYTPHFALSAFGYEAVCRIEAAHFQEVNE